MPLKLMINFMSLFILLKTVGKVEDRDKSFWKMKIKSSIDKDWRKDLSKIVPSV